MSPMLHSGNTRIPNIHVVNCRSSLRNKMVAEGINLAGNIEKYGSGFIRIRKALREYPEVSFKAEAVSGGIALTFTQESQPESQPLAQRVLGILKNGEITKQDISIKLGQRAVSGQLNKIMRDLLQEGVVELTLSR